jgi:anti-sigma regulatory factor (Ser/Thr protein kinase)
VIRSEFSVDSGMQALRDVRVWVESSCEGALPAVDIAPRIVLVLEELITNLAKYSTKSPLNVQLGLTLHDATVELVIEDDGEPFNPMAPPAAGRSRAGGFPVGGYGLQLVRQLMDEVVYSRDGGRNRLAFRKAFV